MTKEELEDTIRHHQNNLTRITRLTQGMVSTAERIELEKEADWIRALIGLCQHDLSKLE